MKKLFTTFAFITLAACGGEAPVANRPTSAPTTPTPTAIPEELAMGWQRCPTYAPRCGDGQRLLE
jgi:hypothetical protein